MKVKLENREYELKANGRFMLKYQDTFNENMVVALYKVMNEKDPLTCCKLTYCAIETEQSFDEWLDSFETPLFIIGEMDRIVEYLIRSTTPNVQPEESDDNSKKKTTT